MRYRAVFGSSQDDPRIDDEFEDRIAPNTSNSVVVTGSQRRHGK
jgi:hypothetical protein